MIRVRANLKPVIMDMRKIAKRISPPEASRALNRVAGSHVETPAVASISREKQLSKGVVRWHHDSMGQRTRRRRLIRIRSTKDRLDVRWKWGTKSGEPGKVSVISLPGRRQNKRGVKAGRGGPDIKSAFIQTSKKGQLGVFTRLSKKRYPIKFLRIDMTSVADASFSKRVRSAFEPFRKEYERLMKVSLRKNLSRGLMRAASNPTKFIS